MLYKIRKYADNTNFTNAVKATFACVFPLVVLTQLGYFQEGFIIALGALLTYPSDVPGSLNHKIKGILIAVFLITGTNLFLGLVQNYTLIVYPVLLLLVFCYSMLSVYGHRANMISFVALISATLVFSHNYKGEILLKHCGYILIGGLFYLFVSLLFYFLRPHRYIDLQLADCLQLTSDYLKLRGDLWNIDANRAKITEKQLELQVEINAIHENIREYLIRNAIHSNNSNQNRRKLIVFTNLVEILEIALSFAFNHNELHQKFESQPEVLKTYQHLAYTIATTLKKMSRSLEADTEYSTDKKLFTALDNLENAIQSYQDKLGKTAAAEGVLMLKNMQHYAQKQIEKLKIIEQSLTGSITTDSINRKNKEIEKFLTPQNYRLETLLENLSFSSTAFRHSLRLSVTILIGFILGKLLPFQNGYWILLTIVVIMRPGYGLTKQRSFERVYGTLLGGAVAFSVLYFTQNEYVLGTLSVIAMIVSYTYSQSNYKIGATFLTIYVIFIYGMLTPNVLEVIQYRIIDTVLGAGLAFFSNYFLWPSWEFLNLNKHLEKSIVANRNYIKEIMVYYNEKGEATTAYKLARKQAFIEIGNLMASFQRMKQEPKSKQKNIAQVYQFVVLNHTLLSAAASLGTYVQSHKTTKASESFNIVAHSVVRNLDLVIQSLHSNRNLTLTTAEKERLDLSFTELKKIRANELKTDGIADEDFQQKMEEAQLVIDQLIWLINLSENVLKVSQNLRNET